MSKYADTEVSGFLLRSGYPIKQIIRVAKELKIAERSEAEERDAEYEVGRGARPKGYDKRRRK